MDTPILVVLLLILVSVIVALIPLFLLPRFRMEKRARGLIGRYPDAERISVYLSFDSARTGNKRQAIDARIAEMASTGWTFLRATEANPWRTIRTWGGGITLQFIRIPPNQMQAKNAEK